MREILFRGKRVDNGEWVYGFYGQFHNRPINNKPNSHQIFELIDEGVKLFGTSIGGYWHIVDPETVGQFTGLTDKNGKKIFEGDIVKTESDLWHGENKKERVTRIGEVIYDEKFCQFGLNIKGFSKCFTLKRWKGDFNEVIGNIHDNPELLKGGADNA